MSQFPKSSFRLGTPFEEIEENGLRLRLRSIHNAISHKTYSRPCKVCLYEYLLDRARPEHLLECKKVVQSGRFVVVIVFPRMVGGLEKHTLR